MTREQLLRLHQMLCNEAQSLMKVKNHDYSGGKDAQDPFLNFTRVEKLGITDTERGFMVRMTDKMSRLITHLDNKTYAVKDESFKDTILDLINYSILMYAYVNRKKGDYEEKQ